MFSFLKRNLRKRRINTGRGLNYSMPVLDNKRFVLDTNILIKFKGNMDKGTLKVIDLEKFKKVVDKYVVNEIPEKNLEEINRDDRVIIRSSPSETLSYDGRKGVKIRYVFDFTGIEDRGCRDFVYYDKSGKGKVKEKKITSPDMELIALCLKHDLIFVSDDKPARKMAESLNIKCIGFDEFIRECNIKNDNLITFN